MVRHNKRVKRVRKPKPKRNCKINKTPRKVVGAPKILKRGRIHKQNTKSTKRDKARHALPPGKRVSKYGHVYYEYRSNHSDNRKWL